MLTTRHNMGVSDPYRLVAPPKSQYNLLPQGALLSSPGKPGWKGGGGTPRRHECSIGVHHAGLCMAVKNHYYYDC